MAFHGLERILELGYGVCAACCRSQAACILDEVHAHQTAAEVAVVAHTIVRAEALIAAGLAQTADAGKPMVVDDHDAQSCALLDRCGDLLGHHQIGAIADHHIYLPLGLRHLDAQASGDFIAHGRIAVLHVIGVRALASPKFVHVARHAARRANNDVALAGDFIDGPNHLALAEQRTVAQSVYAIHFPLPLFAVLANPGCVLGRHPVVRHQNCQLFQCSLCIGHQRQCRVLESVELGHVDVQKANSGILKCCLGGAGEIGVAGSDANDQVSLAG